MITGILASATNSSLFDDIILDLQAIADAPFERDSGFEGLRLPQVHAINCLKDVFIDARLGLSSEEHMADTLEIAVTSLESEVYDLI